MALIYTVILIYLKSLGNWLKYKIVLEKTLQQTLFVLPQLISNISQMPNYSLKIILLFAKLNIQFLKKKLIKKEP